MKLGHILNKSVAVRGPTVLNSCIRYEMQTRNGFGTARKKDRSTALLQKNLFQFTTGLRMASQARAEAPNLGARTRLLMQARPNQLSLVFALQVQSAMALLFEAA